MNKIKDMRGSQWSGNYLEIVNNKLFYCGYRVTDLVKQGYPPSRLYYGVFGGKDKNVPIGMIALEEEDYKKAAIFISPGE